MNVLFYLVSFRGKIRNAVKDIVFTIFDQHLLTLDALCIIVQRDK